MITSFAELCTIVFALVGEHRLVPFPRLSERSRFNRHQRFGPWEKGLPLELTRLEVAATSVDARTGRVGRAGFQRVSSRGAVVTVAPSNGAAHRSCPLLRHIGR